MTTTSVYGRSHIDGFGGAEREHFSYENKEKSEEAEYILEAKMQLDRRERVDREAET